MSCRNKRLVVGAKFILCVRPRGVREDRVVVESNLGHRVGQE